MCTAMHVAKQELSLAMCLCGASDTLTKGIWQLQLDLLLETLQQPVSPTFSMRSLNFGSCSLPDASRATLAPVTPALVFAGKVNVDVLCAAGVMQEMLCHNVVQVGIPFTGLDQIAADNGAAMSADSCIRTLIRAWHDCHCEHTHLPHAGLAWRQALQQVNNSSPTTRPV